MNCVRAWFGFATVVSVSTLNKLKDIIDSNLISAKVHAWTRMHKRHASLSVTMRIYGRCGRQTCKSTLKCRLLYSTNHNNFGNFYADRGSLLNALWGREIFTSYILHFFWIFFTGIMVEVRISEKYSPIIFLQDYARRIWIRNIQYMHEWCNPISE